VRPLDSKLSDRVCMTRSAIAVPKASAGNTHWYTSKRAFGLRVIFLSWDALNRDLAEVLRAG